MTTDLDLAWLAGFVDGDGCIHMNVNDSPVTPPRKSYIVCGIIVSNTSIPAIERVKSIMSSLIGREVRYTARAVRGYRPIYNWKIKRMDEVRAVLTALLPYLVAKREQADTMLAYLDRKVPFARTGEDFSEFAEKMKHLNRRYSPGEWLPARDRTASTGSAG